MDLHLNLALKRGATDKRSDARHKPPSRTSSRSTSGGGSNGLFGVLKHMKFSHSAPSSPAPSASPSPTPTASALPSSAIDLHVRALEDMRSSSSSAYSNESPFDGGIRMSADTTVAHVNGFVGDDRVETVPERITLTVTPYDTSDTQNDSPLVLLPRTVEDDEDEFDRIVAVFVTRFDPLRGNIIEFQYPETADLSGVEFTSLPSGAHLVTRDTVYFSRPPAHFGIAAFERFDLASADPGKSEGSGTGAMELEKERGARSKAVGVVCTGMSGMHRHLPFLREQASRFVRNAGSTDALVDYVEKQNVTKFHNVTLMHSIGIPELQLNSPLASFGSFVDQYEASIFVLWKYAILKRRILFFSNPPVEPLCHNVFCTLLLSSHTVPEFLHQSAAVDGPISPDVHPNVPLYFVNVADIPLLSSLPTYVCATTEAIFQLKQQLYDLFIHNKQLVFPPSTARSTISLSSSSTSITASAYSSWSSPSTPTSSLPPSIPYASASAGEGKMSFNDQDKWRYDELKKVINAHSPSHYQNGSASAANELFSGANGADQAQSSLWELPKSTTSAGSDNSGAKLSRSNSWKRKSKDEKRRSGRKSFAMGEEVKIVKWGDDDGFDAPHANEESTLQSEESVPRSSQGSEHYGTELKLAVRLVDFFERINNNLFSTLLAIAQSSDPVLRPCRIRGLLGLHPTHDVGFLRSIISVYVLPLSISSDHLNNPMNGLFMNLKRLSKSTSANVVGDRGGSGFGFASLGESKGAAGSTEFVGRDPNFHVCCPVPSS
ncbi:hypothetical protein BJ742DRAFT_844059 [Cladochytrium replicatum]|nr:hypothetical protein BJ742DRAFT_844059 [Cladochytrium replicatum]